MYPNQVAIRRDRASVTFSQLWDDIEAVTENARLMGFGTGQTFLFVAQPGPRTLAVALGLLKVGLRLAFIDPFTAVASFHTRVDLVRPDLVIADAKLYLLGHPGSRWLRKAVNLNVVDYATISGATHFVSGLHFLPKMPKRAGRIEEFLKNPSSSSRSATALPDPNADAVVVFTSGTTGDPKGVVHSLESLSASFESTANAFDFRPGEVLLSEPMTVGLVALCRGVTWVIPGKKLPARVDKYFGVPTDVIKLLDALTKHPDRCKGLRQVAMGGAPVLPSLIRRIHGVLGKDTRTLSVYGMTEILPAAIATGEDKLATTDSDLLGVPVQGVEFAFAPDKEILVRGPGLMKGYLGKPPSSWHATGDLGYLDDQGRLRLLGRKKNMLIRADMNIYPSLYEPGLCTIQGVADAVIVGAPDAIGDDRVVLFVVPLAGISAKDLLRRVELEVPRHMDQQAYPDRIEVLDHLPISGRGQKRDMAKLRKLALALFDGEV
jgi:acyl-CoA synthetase (AMP-forming)/AMP-acid ligase II